MISPYESVYIFTLGGTGTTLGIITALQMLFSTFIRVPGGYIADRYGRRRIIGLAILASGFGYLFYIFARNWVWLIPGALILSIQDLAVPATEAIKVDSVNPENRGKGFAIINTLPDILALFAPALGGYLVIDNAANYGISLPGIRLVYFAVFIGVLLTGLIRLFFLKDLIEHEKVERRGILHMFRDAITLVNESEQTIKRLLLLGGFFMFCFHLDARMRAVYAIDAGLSTVEWGWIVSVTSVVSLVSGLFIGGLVDKFGRKNVFVPSVLLLGLSTFLFLVSSGFWMFLLARVLGGIGLYGRMISFQVLVADMVPVDSRGRVMAVYSIFSSIGTTSAILLSGFLYDVFAELPFILSAIAFILAAIVGKLFLNET